MFKDSFNTNDNFSNHKLLSKLMKNISMNICCNSCPTEFSSKNLLKEKLLKDKTFDQNNINNFQIEFIPVGVIKKSKGRKKWSDVHNKILENCLKLFGKNMNQIKLFFDEFSESHLMKKINKAALSRFYATLIQAIHRHTVAEKLMETFKKFNVLFEINLFDLIFGHNNKDTN